MAADKIKPHPLNWRKHSKQQREGLQSVLESIGFAGAVLTFKDDEGSLVAIDGHLRREQMSGQKVPVLTTDLTAEEASAVLATFDPIGAMATADTSKLDELMKGISTDGIGSLLSEISSLNGVSAKLLDVVEDDQPSEVDSLTQSGDIWQLGSHRLMCGDSTVTGNVAMLMDGIKAGLCFTSPPYSQQRDYTEESQLDDWDGLMCGAFDCLQLSADGQVLVNLGLIHRDNEWVSYWDEWIEWMRSQGWRKFAWYVWDQLAGMMGNWSGRLAPSNEFVFHFNKNSVQPVKWVSTQVSSRVKKNAGDGGQRGKDGIVKDMYSIDKTGQALKIPDSVIRISRNATIDMARNNHPATFPVELPAFFIRSWKGVVYDPFIGSGTTMIAAEQLDRVCYGMEISPQYCDVVVKRWETLTGKKATRNGKEQ